MSVYMQFLIIPVARHCSTDSTNAGSTPRGSSLDHKDIAITRQERDNYNTALAQYYNANDLL